MYDRRGALFVSKKLSSRTFETRMTILSPSPAQKFASPKTAPAKSLFDPSSEGGVANAAASFGKMLLLNSSSRYWACAAETVVVVALTLRQSPVGYLVLFCTQ